jgi:hypothetical protein
MSEANDFFLSPRLTGKRFDEHSVPIEILQDFGALEELIVELAKNIYLQENPKRKRVPKGFTDGVTLNLEKIEEGSTILNFVLASTFLGTTILGPTSNSYTYFEKAKEKVIKIIDQAEKGNDLKSIVDEKYLTYFNRIGRSLKDDEDIYLSPKSYNKGPKLNRTTRKTIMLAIGEDATYVDKFSITALITSIDRSGHFTIESDGHKIGAKSDRKFYDTIMKTFSDLDLNTHVSIEGSGVFNKNDKLIKIEAISSMEILHPLDVSFRLSELSKLKDGWYNSEGIAPYKRGLINFEKNFLDNYDSNLPLPAIFPTYDGNIQLEWTVNLNEISLEVNLKDLVADFMKVDVATNNIIENKVDLNKLEDWVFINSNIK